MLGWLKSLGKTGGEWRRAPFPEKDLDLLYQDFLPLDTLDPHLPAELVLHIAMGGNAGVLARLASLPDAAKMLGLRCERHACEFRLPLERDAFFATTTILDPAFHLRLAQVYEAAMKPAGKRAPSPGIPAGGEWMEYYLWEATRTPPNGWPLHPHETRLAAPALESMLKLSGHPGTWLARAALTVEPPKGAKGKPRSLGALLLKVPELAVCFTANPAIVLECLNAADPKCRAHGIEVLHQAGVSASLLPEQAVAMAVGTSKAVRDVAAAWIVRTPELLLPELQKTAVNGTPEERAHAVTLLAMAGHGMMTPFLLERLKRDKARKVLRAIETVLGHPR